MNDKEKPKLNVVTPEFVKQYYSERPEEEQNAINYEEAEKELAEAIEKLKKINPRPDPDDCA